MQILINFSQVLSEGQSMELPTQILSQEDKEVGLALYTIVLHCPKDTMKLGQFLLQLVKEESLPSLILAITNTLLSEELTLYQKRKLGMIYQVLNSIFKLNLGNILIATSTPSQLVALQDQMMPFLNSKKTRVEKCLSEQFCDDVLDQIRGNAIYKRVHMILSPISQKHPPGPTPSWQPFGPA